MQVVDRFIQLPVWSVVALQSIPWKFNKGKWQHGQTWQLEGKQFHCTKFPASVQPEAEGGVGEVRRAVKVSDSQAAADVVHGGQGGVLPLHDPSLDGALVGAVAEGHQPVVVVQTGRGDGSEFCGKNSLEFLLDIPASSAHLLQTTPHLENLDWLLMRFTLSGFRPPSMESVQTSHSLCPVAKFQKGIAKFSFPVNLCEEEM